MKDRNEKAESTLAAEPIELSGRHRALMRRLISGMSIGEACEELGFSSSRASVVIHSPLFQAEMQRMREEMAEGFVEAEADRGQISADPTRKYLQDSAEMAALTLKGALSDDNVTIRVNAAKDILDRTGYAKEDKLKAKVLVEPSQSLVDVIGRIVQERTVDEPTD